MANSQEVDYLIWLGKASWHPGRHKKARLRVKFWVWSNSLGSWVGEFHPLIRTYLQRSSSLCTVLKATVVEEVCLTKILSERRVSEGWMALDMGPKEKAKPEMETEQRDMDCCKFQSKFDERVFKGKVAKPMLDTREKELKVGRDKKKDV